MRITVSSIGRFTMFEMARQLMLRGHLQRLYTSYPSCKVDADLRAYTETSSHFLLAYMASKKLGLNFLIDNLSYQAHEHIDQWVSRKLENCDLVIALAKGAYYTILEAKHRGIISLCHRSSTHISYQNELLTDEFNHQGIRAEPVPLWGIERELAEYEETDYILVPSSFVYRTFLEKGISEGKLVKVIYGVNLQEFRPVARKDNIFRVLYVGTLNIRKGIPYLLEALADLNLPNFELTLIGGIEPEIKPFMEKYASSYKYLGFLPRLELYQYYSQGSVFIFPSLEEGLANVIAQAMACGLPVVATPNSGAEDLINDGIEGFIIPARDSRAIRDKVLYLYENRVIRDEMAQNALERVQLLGGWETYGRELINICEQLLIRPKFQNIDI